jgi:hypothetical protein
MKSMAVAVLPVLSKYFRPIGSKIRPRGLKEIQHYVHACAYKQRFFNYINVKKVLTFYTI